MFGSESDGLPQHTLDITFIDVEAFLGTAAGHTWLAMPSPRVTKQACHWLLSTDQGHDWLSGGQGIARASQSTGAVWYKEVLKNHAEDSASADAGPSNEPSQAANAEPISPPVDGDVDMQRPAKNLF